MPIMKTSFLSHSSNMKFACVSFKDCSLWNLWCPEARFTCGEEPGTPNCKDSQLRNNPKNRGGCLYYPLVMTNIRAAIENIEIVGFPTRHGEFHSYVSYQRVTIIYTLAAIPALAVHFIL